MRRAAVFLMLWLANAAALAYPVPRSLRADAVEARVAPRLGAEMRTRGLRLGAPVFLRITKIPAELTLFVAGADGRFAPFRTYPICAFSGALGPKLRVGDGQAPEGFYAVPAAAMNPSSAFHLSFDLGYPNAYDRARGRTGSALMVHGNCVSIGCYAIGDAAIEEIWTAMAAAFRAGQARVQVHAFPFPMTDNSLAAHASDPNASFWAELKAGADVFARSGKPPLIRVRGDHYAAAE